MLLPRNRLSTVAFAAAFAALLPRAAAAEDVIVKRFSGGDTANSVGIADASEDVELAGPQALAVGADGDLFVLDQLNQRIIRFDPKRPAEEPGILQMPESVQPNDLVVRKDEILVWDRGIHTLKASGDATSTRGIGGTTVKLEEVELASGRRRFCDICLCANGIATARKCSRTARPKYARRHHTTGPPAKPAICGLARPGFGRCGYHS